MRGRIVGNEQHPLRSVAVILGPEGAAVGERSKSPDGWACAYSWRTTLSRASLIWMPPLYSMKPSFRKLFMK
jgi:hypothetical protein